MHVQKLADLRKQRSAALDQMEPLAVKVTLTADEQKSYDTLAKEVDDIDAAIERTKAHQERMIKSAQPVAGQSTTMPAQVRDDGEYTAKSGLVLGGVARMLAAGRDVRGAGDLAEKTYGGQHPVTKALGEGTGVAGGFLVQPEFYPGYIELLRAEAVVRSANPLSIPMPRGTMTLPAQTSAANASYSGEAKAINSSQPGVGQRIATAKDLTALVPISNDLLRDSQYSAAADALVRDDLVLVTALREDLAFLTGDGTSNTPRGYLSIATAFGTNLLPSNASYTLATVSQELGAARTALKRANVPLKRPCWFFGAGAEGYLFNVQNSFGEYVFRDEMLTGKLLGVPFKMSTQIPENVTYNGTANTSYVILAEMTETMILDTMQLELAVSQEASYVDTQGVQQNAFQNNQTLIRAVSRHDFQMRHDASVAVIQGVAWQPVIV